MIFHVFGTQCSGKSTVIKKVKKEIDAVSWDIEEDFYIPHKIIQDNKIQWDMWRELIDLMPQELTKFIEDNKNNIVLIESSGLNRKINPIVKSYNSSPVFLKYPKDVELKVRAISKGLSPSDVTKFKKITQQRFKNFKGIKPKQLSVEEAVETIIKLSKYSHLKEIEI